MLCSARVSGASRLADIKEVDREPVLTSRPLRAVAAAEALVPELARAMGR